MKPSILVVDDEQSIRRTLRDILEYENYTVSEAEDGEKAAGAHRIDPSTARDSVSAPSGFCGIRAGASSSSFGSVSTRSAR